MFLQQKLGADTYSILQAYRKPSSRAQAQQILQAFATMQPSSIQESSDDDDEDDEYDNDDDEGKW